MAITILKYPEGIYPAYNDSFIEFSSDLAGDNKAEIIIDPPEIFTRNFIIYPDTYGKYLFNLKEAVKVVFNENGFKDVNYFTDSFFKNVSGLNLSQLITIKVYNSTTFETDSFTYEFFRGVKQFGESVFSNPFQLLSFSKDGINHYLTYFEGFPFHFDLLKVVSGDDILIENLNTGNDTGAMATTANTAFRINVDRSGNLNWTIDNFLPLIEGLNRLEIYSNSVFKSNLFLTKKKICSGIYLKWFNRNGGYSHYLFNQYYIEQIKSSEMGKVFNDEFENIKDSTGNYKSSGKSALGNLNVKARFESQDYEILKDIFTSPLVQIYTSRTAYVEGRFIDIFVSGTFSFSNKRGQNEISLIIKQPEIQTAIL